MEMKAERPDRPFLGRVIGLDMGNPDEKKKNGIQQMLAKKILDMQVDTNPLTEARRLFVDLDEKVTAREAILIGQAVKAMVKGDASSANLLRGLAGEIEDESGPSTAQNPFASLTPDELRAYIRTKAGGADG